MYRDADYPADPYPGRRPDRSFVHVDGIGYPLAPAPSGYVVLALPKGQQGDIPPLEGEQCHLATPPPEDLDRWLDKHDAPPLAGRTPVLAYGSNACPQKITWLRDTLGLAGPVVVLRARCRGYSAVWAAGVRSRDGRRPATLIAAPGIVEEHAVWLATAAQLRVLDVCEGADDARPRYRREVLSPDAVVVDGDRPVMKVHAYLGARADRQPLLVDGRSLRVAQCPPP